jgi:hypothetical protein
VAERVYARVAIGYMKREGIYGLINFSGDHNVCSTCKKLDDDENVARDRVAEEVRVAAARAAVRAR